MKKPTLDDLIAERTEKAVECHMFADAQRDAGNTKQSDAWKISADYAAATADFLRELRALKSN